MSGRPETAPLLTMAERARGRRLRLGVDRRLAHRAAAPRAAHADGRRRRAHAARAARHRRAAARAAQPRRAGPHRRHARPRRRGPRHPRRRLRRRHAGDPQGVRRRRRAVRAPRRAASSRRSRSAARSGAATTSASAASTSRSTTSPMEPKPHRPGGPPIWIGGSGPTGAARGRALRRVVPDRAQRGVLRRALPAHPGRRARGRAAPADAVTGAAYVTLALDADRAAAEQRLQHLPRDVLRGAGRRDPGPPGQLRGPDRGLRGVAPALDRRGRAPPRAALRRRRSARAGGRGGRAAACRGCGEKADRHPSAGAARMALRWAWQEQLAVVGPAPSRSSSRSWWRSSG